MAEPASPAFETDGTYKVAAAAVEGGGAVMASHRHSDAASMRFDVASEQPAPDHDGHPFAHSTLINVTLTGTEKLWILGPAGRKVSVTRDAAPA